MRVLRAWQMVLLAAVLGAALAACGGGGGGLAADGGVSGTGLSAITGNVSAITTGSGDLAGIRVEIAGTGITTVTDAGGSFSLSGEFEGPVTVVFERDDGVRAETIVDVPSGGTVTLEDVTLDPETEDATPARRTTSFNGEVESADCPASRLFVSTRGDGRPIVTVRLEDAFVHDGDGAPVECARLRAGDRVRVEGVILEDGSVGEADIELLPPPATATPARTRTPHPTETPRASATATRVPDPDATRDQPGPTATPRRSDGPSDRTPATPTTPTATATRPQAMRTAAPLDPVDRRRAALGLAPARTGG